MASSTQGSFPENLKATEAEWRMHLTAVAGPLRACFGEGPANVVGTTGVPVMVADNRGKSEPMLVTVQVATPGLVVFGRAPPTLLNGIQHTFPIDGSSFRQILMPGDRLFANRLAASTTFIVTSTVV